MNASFELLLKQGISTTHLVKHFASLIAYTLTLVTIQMKFKTFTAKKVLLTEIRFINAWNKEQY